MSKELEKMKTADLRKLAEKEKVEGYEEMEREDLLKALKSEGTEEKEEEENLDDLTVPQLKELAKEKGIDLKKAKTKQPIIKAIKKGEKKKEKEEGSEKEERTEVVGMGIKEEHVPVGSKAEKMKEHLAKQPKVKILIPLESKEKIGATESVILNGYRVNILKGVYVEVPEQVAEVIMDSQKQTRKALDHALKIAGKRPELGAE